MRPDLSAPDPQAHEPSHTTVIRAPHPIAFNPRTDLEAIGQLVRALHFTARHRDLGGKELRMLVSLLALVNGKHFRATGEMICWPGEVALADALGFKRSSNVHRVMQELVRLELVERTTFEIDGQHRKAYRLLAPEPRSDGLKATGGTTRDRRGMRARPKWARAEETARARNGQSARAHSGRAQKAAHTKDLARAGAGASKSETKKSSNTAAAALPLPEQEPPVDGRRAAAAAELEGLDVRPGKIRELLELPTTSRAIVRAAEKARKSRNGEGGLLVWFVEHPAEIPPKYLRQAERELQRPAVPATSPAVQRPAPAVMVDGVKAMKDALAKVRGEQHQAKPANPAPPRPPGPALLGKCLGGVR